MAGVLQNEHETFPQEPSQRISISQAMDNEADKTDDVEGSAIVEKELERIGFGPFHIIAAITLGLGNAADAVEVLAISYVLPHIRDTTDAEKGFLSSSFFVGMLVGGLICGVMSDHIGRKPCLLVSLFLNSLFGVLSALSPNFPLLFLCRLIAGIGVGGSVPSVFTMATEYMSKQRRGMFITTIAWWWMVGAVYTAGTAWLFIGILKWNWKVFLGLCSIPAALCTVFSWAFLPETPRYHYARKNFEQVVSVLSQMSLQNGKPPSQISISDLVAESGKMEEDITVYKKYEGEPRLEKQFKDQSKRRQRALTEEKKKLIENSESEEPFMPNTLAKAEEGSEKLGEVEAIGGGSEKGIGRTWTETLREGAKRTIRETSYLFQPELLRVTLVLFFVWFALNFGWYGLVSWTPTLFHNTFDHTNNGNSSEPTPTPDPDSVDVYRDTFFVQAANLPGNIISALLMDYMGRKWLLVGTMMISAAVAGLLSLLLWKGTSSTAVVVLACLFNGVSVGGWNALDVLSAESFPTVLRTTAMGILAAVGRIGSVAAQLVYAQMIKDRLSELMLLSAVVMLIGGLAGIFLAGDKTKKNLSDTFR